MSIPVRLVAVKLSPVGRSHLYPISNNGPEVPVRPGDTVVVQTEGGPAVGKVVPSVGELEERRQPAADSPNKFVRVATHQDIVARLKQEHFEREAHRIALL